MEEYSVREEKLVLDIASFFAFLAIFEPASTGVPLHEWPGLAFAGSLIVHRLLHWQWIVNVTLRFFRKSFHSSRLNHIVDALMYIAFTAVMLSGLMISRSILALLGIEGMCAPFWRLLHAGTAGTTLILVGLHFALHWK